MASSVSEKETAMRRKTGTVVRGLALAAVVGLIWSATGLAAGKGGQRGLCGPPPPAKVQRQAAAEGKEQGSAVSKLPCAPTRRTEKKSPPAPPALVAKLSFGDNQDWQTDRNDIYNIMKTMHRQFGVKFRPIVVSFSNFSFSPGDCPTLYMTGHNSFTLTGKQRQRVRSFVEQGGTLIVDNCCGSESFGNAAKRELRRMFPDRRFKVLPQDHPVFSCFHKLSRVRYSGNVTDQPNGAPYLEGVDFGCRTAMFYSKYDLSCGWDNHTHPHGKRVLPADAVKMGVNIFTYALANYRQAPPLSEAKAYVNADKEPRGKVTFAQVKYRGDWNRHAAATDNLLASLGKSFSADVKFQRVDVELTDPQIFSLPLLYIAGHDDFSLTDEEVESLRKYLKQGGFLLAESCCGRQAFDAAFRREIAKVLPDQKLQSLPSDHPAISMCYPVMTVGECGRLNQVLPHASPPQLEGVDMDGATAVVYSKYSLGCGWAEGNCAYCLGYGRDTALKLGVNLIACALSH